MSQVTFLWHQRLLLSPLPCSANNRTNKTDDGVEGHSYVLKGSRSTEWIAYSSAEK
jgi:hypothetical protein